MARYAAGENCPANSRGFPRDQYCAYSRANVAGSESVRGRSKIPLMIVKMPVLIPIPIASVNVTAIDTNGAFRIIRSPYARSRIRPLSQSTRTSPLKRNSWYLLSRDGLAGYLLQSAPATHVTQTATLTSDPPGLLFSPAPRLLRARPRTRKSASE